MISRYWWYLDLDSDSVWMFTKQYTRILGYLLWIHHDWVTHYRIISKAKLRPEKLIWWSLSSKASLKVSRLAGVLVEDQNKFCTETTSNRMDHGPSGLLISASNDWPLSVNPGENPKRGTITERVLREKIQSAASHQFLHVAMLWIFSQKSRLVMVPKMAYIFVQRGIISLILAYAIWN